MRLLVLGLTLIVLVETVMLILLPSLPTAPR